MSYSESENRVIEETKNWISKFIIGLNICPFAGASFQQNKIHFRQVDSEDKMLVFDEFLKHIVELTESEEISNSFLIMSNKVSFEQYLEIYYSCEDLLEQSKADQVFQLASFHPDYVYDGLVKEDAANFRNRSPYPLIHILRVNEVELAIEKYGNTLEIPDINSAKLKALGIDEIQKIISEKN